MKWAGVTFACSHCGAVFASPDALRAHALRRASEPGGVSQRASAAPHAGAVGSARGQTGVTFACTLCGDAFRTGDELRAHLARHRLTMGDAPASVIEEAGRALELGTAADAGDEVLPASSPSLRASRRGPRARVPDSDTGPRAAPHRRAGTRRRGSRLERREARRTRRRRDRSRAFALLAATALLLLLSSASALAWFTATTSGSVTITTGVWADYLAFSPGGSRAIYWPDGGPTQLLPVATADDEGEISLDFGDVLAGTRRYWHDVLRVTSTAAEPLRLTFAVDGPAAPYIAQVRLVKGGSGDLLDPGATRGLAVRLVAPAGAAPGVYTGTLSVTVVGATERHDFPLTLSIVCERPRPSPSPSCSDQPSPDAAPTPDESPSEAPSASPAPSPDSSASPAPSPDPSASPSPSPSPSGPGDASPSPEPSPSSPPDTPSALFALSAGSSTVLPASSPAGVPVAQVVAGGALHLDFGELPAGEPVVFADVARVSSSVEEPISVTLSLAGPIDGVVRSVGFADGAGGIVGTGLVVAAGETERLAFGFDLGSSAAAGLYQGVLNVTAELGDGAVQRCQVPVAATVMEAEAASDDAASADRATSLTLWLRRLWTLVQRPDGSAWQPALLLVTQMH